ncbi:putative N-lysine methyltransferase SETD8-B isoform X2 [Apostichopus japonicus]|uniref:[histone H4]-lysine(20) N-methyltransferase n=1 Tax=Stichopus japonicus TaxID=307972 RepID=A0A2G8KTF2_STIJA|nr:putative N-lysine methyltransferase SETD8-B isoform X2 [Apostichopus japonicus]
MEEASATQLEKGNEEASQPTDRSTNTTDQHLSVNKDAVESSTEKTCRAKVAADEQPSSSDDRKEDSDAKVKRSVVTPKDQMKMETRKEGEERRRPTYQINGESLESTVCENNVKHCQYCPFLSMFYQLDELFCHFFLFRITLKQQSPVMKRLTDFFPVRRSNRRCKSSIEVEEKKRLEKAILTGQEEGLEAREIDGKGRGVIATKDFAKGQFVVEYYGDLIDVTKAKELEAKYGMDPSIGCYMYYFEFKNKRYCVDATKESGRLGRLLNHSKTGNCCTKLVPIQSKPHLILVAKRDIKEGEELLYDYGDRSKEVLESHPWLAS